MNQKTRPVHLFTLHYPGESWSKSNRADYTVEEAVAKWGGTFIPREGGICMSSNDPRELNVCGILCFTPEMFREMDETDRALAGIFPGDVVYTEHGLGLLAKRGETVKLVVRQDTLLF